MSYSPPPVFAVAQGAQAWAPRRLLVWQRAALALTGTVLIGLLTLAAVLTPNPRGFGTHRQLGLPKCTVMQWYNIPCPSCGMTTSWSHMMRGQVLRAAQANAGGMLLAIAAAVFGPWMLVSGLRGSWLFGPPPERLLLAVGVVIVLTTLVDWCLRLTLGI